MNVSRRISNHFRILLIGLVVILALFIAAHNAKIMIKRLSSDVIGVLNKIPDKVAGLDGYIWHLENMQKGMRNMSWEDYRVQEATKLHFEIKIWRVASEALKGLSQLNQLKE